MMLLSIHYWLIRLLKLPHFTLLIKNGSVVQKSGRIKLSFASECLQVLKRNGIQSACIYASKNQYGHIVIHAAGTMPPDVLQQLRNMWSFY